ncbi:carbohydrate kinase family protein [Methanocaldococcus indicus]|uniref:carbohydrate kinase family protein n=1 Tax=Methanocaldococcus indicus TaxID=213231 RepID=UPI003C6D1A14
MIATVGHTALDYIFNVEKFPEPNTSIQIPTAKKYYGGAAANVAVGIKKLGVDSKLISCVGYDFEYLNNYKKYLEDLGVDISSLYYSNEEETPKAWIFTDKDNNQMTFFLWGASKHFVELNPKIDNAKIIHLATGEPKYNLKVAETNNKCIISFDPGQDLPKYDKDLLLNIIKNTNILFFNKYEFERASKLLGFNKEDYLEYVDVFVITKGSEGSEIITKDKEKIFIPAIKTIAIDPTGAGDAYKAGFLVGYYKGYDLEKCGLIGAATASFVVEKKGCQTNLPSWKEVIERLKKHGYVIE